MSYAELIAEANAVSTNDVVANPRRYRNLIGRLAERLEAADQRAAELAAAARYEGFEAGWAERLEVVDKKSRDLFQENYELGRQRDQLAAVVERVREYADQVDPANLDEQPMWPSTLRDILATAPADVLREHNAALIEGLATEAGYSLVHHEEAVAFLRREARQRREEQS